MKKTDMNTHFNAALYAGTPTLSVLDARGLTVRELAWHRSEAGGLTDTRISRYQHDAAGRLVQSSGPRALTAPDFHWHTGLTGQLLRTQSCDAGRTLMLSDIEGRPVRALSATEVVQRWHYEPDSLPGRLLTITQQNDEGNKVTDRFIHAGSSPEEQHHNLAGQCLRHYDSAGLDALESRALSGVPLSQYRQLLQDGQDADWADENESAWQSAMDTGLYRTRMTADATGAVLTQIDACGNQQRMAFDTAGNLKGSWLHISGQEEQVVIRSLTYSAAGQKLQEEHANGVTTIWQYEAQTGRTVGIRTLRTRSSGTNLLQDLHYQYDPAGNIISLNNRAQKTRFWRNQKVVPESLYSYDSLYQLISASGREMAGLGQQQGQLPAPLIPLPENDDACTPYTQTYQYDRGGNLTRIQHSAAATGNCWQTNIVVSAHSNRALSGHEGITADDIDGFFDTAGHQTILAPGQPLAWTQRGELSTVTAVARETTSDREWYRYNGAGLRVLKMSEQQTKNSTQQQRVLYLPGLELRTRLSAGKATESLQVITLGEAGRAQVRALYWETGLPQEIENRQLRYSYDNLIGSSQLELDSDGNLISLEDYYPYGGTAMWATRNQTEAGYKTLRYSGKERDATGLYYYGYRYYQPGVGRWLSADPAGTVDGLNLYRMVKNNPVRFFDPDGHHPQAREAIRRQVSEEFILDSHMEAIEQASLKSKAAVSFRAAGAATLVALAKGAAAKGHDILEKTIKEKSIQNAYALSGNWQEILNKVNKAGISGYVGHWNEQGLAGIYMSSGHNLGDQVKKVGPHSIYPVDINNLEASLKGLKAQPNWESLPFTGDYDTHDMLTFRGAGKPRTVMVDSSEEKEIINTINREIAGADNYRPFSDKEHNVIRHGPQVNYSSFMLSHEAHEVKKQGGFVGAVARPGEFPLAMVYRGEWSIINNLAELNSFYQQAGAVMKQSWQENGSVSFAETGKGIVRLARQRSIPR